MSDADQNAFRLHLTRGTVPAARVACVLVAILTLSGSVLDWTVHPDKALQFLFVRSATACVSLAILGLTFIPWLQQYAKLLFVAPVFAAAISIQVMIQYLGGYTSSYYAGLNLCILGFAITTNLDLKETALACFTIAFMWVALALITSSKLVFSTFFHNTFFLMGTASISLGAAALRYRLVQNEFYATQRLKELDSLKSQFFANVSHELRTPLTLSLGPIETLLVDIKGDSQRDRLLMVHRNLRRLLRLINNLLDFAKVEAGKTTLRVTPVDVGRLLEGWAQAVRVASETRGTQFALELPAEPVLLYVDREKMEKMVMNLLSNAFKFTDVHGKISLKLSVHGHEVKISVSDTGLGIPDDKLDSIFERFSQVDSSSKRKYAGTGIGLALVKEYVELHGGRVQVQSKLGEGSTFTLVMRQGHEHLVDADIVQAVAADDNSSEQLDAHGIDVDAPMLEDVEPEMDSSSEPPIEAPQLSEAGQAELHALEAVAMKEKARVLVVDDTVDMRRYIKGILADDHLIWTAKDGMEGLELAKKLLPDLIVSDVMMPRMDGDEFCRALKAEPPPLGRTPVILVTARAEQEAKLLSLEHGADDYLFKPFHPMELKLRVRNLLRERKKERALYLAHQRLDNVHQTLQEDLDEARHFQESLLSAPPLPQPFSFYAVYRPMMQVGGDIYDITTLDAQRIRVWLGDMAGHGVRASLRTALVKAAYDRLKGISQTPGDVFSELNTQLLDQHQGHAAFAGVCFDLEKEEPRAIHLRYTGSGDVSLWRLSKQGKLDKLETEGVYVGALMPVDFPTLETELVPGDRLFCFSDGLEEQKAPDGRVFEASALDDVLRSAHHAPDIERAVQGIVSAWESFRGDTAIRDDVTVLGFEMH